jgi:hypothetical protein
MKFRGRRKPSFTPSLFTRFYTSTRFGGCGPMTTSLETTDKVTVGACGENRLPSQHAGVCGEGVHLATAEESVDGGGLVDGIDSTPSGELWTAQDYPFKAEDALEAWAEERSFPTLDRRVRGVSHGEGHACTAADHPTLCHHAALTQHRVSR